MIRFEVRHDRTAARLVLSFVRPWEEVMLLDFTTA
jgi:hypothetical protein